MTVEDTKGQESTSELNKLLNGEETKLDSSEATEPTNQTNDEPSKEVPDKLSSNAGSIEDATVIEGEPEKTQSPSNKRVKSSLKGATLVLSIFTLALVTLGGFVLQLHHKTTLLQEEVVQLRKDSVMFRFYPYGEVVTLLKEQGYNMHAINQYNKNMIGILNAKGITVIPEAMVDGNVPENLIAELMTVEEMNQLANE